MPINDEKPGIVISVRNFNAYYSDKKALKEINLDFYKNKITAIIGPSGCGKSTLLRSINRMNDEIVGFRTEGEILYNGKNVNDKKLDLTLYRKNVGMVFQKPTPFHVYIR